MKDDLIPDMEDKLHEESSFFTKILKKIPGFKGYLESSQRREADRILRSAISARLEEVRLKLSSVHQELSRDIVLAMDHAEALGRIDTSLSGLSGKMKDAPSGYSGFFAANKIEPEDLENIYQFDAAMVNHVETIEAEVANLESAVLNGGNVGAAVRALNDACREAVSAFNGRHDLMTGVSS